MLAQEFASDLKVGLQLCCAHSQAEFLEILVLVDRYHVFDRLGDCGANGFTR